MNIGLLIIATGKYKMFLADLIKSADKFFFTKDSNYTVHYYLFVDKKIEILSSNRSITQIIIDHDVWPFSTLCRYDHFTKNKNYFNDLNYIYYIDSDMIFVNYVDKEILSDIVCVTHPGYIGSKGTPETNLSSLACIPEHIQFQYIQNAFCGGDKDCMLNMFQFLANQIEIDYKRGIIAKWHDESHANKFYAIYTTKLLSSEYCYKTHPSQKCTQIKELIPRIVEVPKNNNEMRS